MIRNLKEVGLAYAGDLLDRNDIDTLDTLLKVKTMLVHLDSIKEDDIKDLLLTVYTGYKTQNPIISRSNRVLIDAYYKKIFKGVEGGRYANHGKVDITDLKKKIGALTSMGIQDPVINEVNSLIALNYEPAVTPIQEAEIDEVIRKNRASYPSANIEIGAGKRGTIRFILKEERERNLMTSIAQTIYPKIDEVIEQIHTLSTLSQDSLERVYNAMLSGEDSGANEALVFLFHTEMVDDVVVSYILTSDPNLLEIIKGINLKIKNIKSK